eukprot:CAMPEP_0117002342 /NCGR_PEP_ID=MMETSP0472-20121206/4049_1 /TAXON_ID=693140 ORGANISM="Tiarina fusus, Strain LIS" /NCGR_SAMPLE_ID=MMETSP0472 /ASSEMBLY_ACC=CAM_ASM_000603 /LENGTH=806 /DNA_ID=CAMNT_0004702669 /DNA_START=55 /DNA_END=2472 /DNA_ORIENTATION=+
MTFRVSTTVFIFCCLLGVHAAIYGIKGGCMNLKSDEIDLRKHWGTDDILLPDGFVFHPSTFGCICAINDTITSPAMLKYDHTTWYGWNTKISEIEIQSDPTWTYEQTTISIGDTIKTKNPTIHVIPNVSNDEFQCYTLRECKKQNSVTIAQITLGQNAMQIHFTENMPREVQMCGFENTAPYFTVKYEPSSVFHVIWPQNVNIIGGTYVFRQGESVNLRIIGANNVTTNSDNIIIQKLPADSSLVLSCPIYDRDIIETIAIVSDQASKHFKISCPKPVEQVELFFEEANLWVPLDNHAWNIIGAKEYKCRLSEGDIEYSTQAVIETIYSAGGSILHPSVITIKQGLNDLIVSSVTSEHKFQIVGDSGEELNMKLQYFVSDHSASMREMPQMVVPSVHHQVKLYASGGSGSYNCYIGSETPKNLNFHYSPTEDKSYALINTHDLPFGEVTVFCDDALLLNTLNHTAQFINFPDQIRQSFFIGLPDLISPKIVSPIVLQIGDDLVVDFELARKGDDSLILFPLFPSDFPPESLSSLLQFDPPNTFHHLQGFSYRVNTQKVYNEQKIKICLHPDYAGPGALPNQDIILTVSPIIPLELNREISFCQTISLYNLPVENDSFTNDPHISCITNDSRILGVNGIMVTGIQPGASSVTCQWPAGPDSAEMTLHVFSVTVKPPEESEIDLSFDLIPGATVPKGTPVHTHLKISYLKLTNSHVANTCPVNISWEHGENLLVLEKSDDDSKIIFKPTTTEEHNFSATLSWGGRTWTHTQSLSVHRNWKALLTITACTTTFVSMLGIIFYLYLGTAR